MTNLSYLDRLTNTGELYESLPDKAVRCVACGHRCLIRPGKRGICHVRFNNEGELRVPWGYVGALQADPIEKKPFSHVLPGATALTFGMLGCDFHCGYCFTGDTMIMTNYGPITFQAAFENSKNCLEQPDGEIAFPDNLQAITSSGGLKQVKGVFRHHYQGELVKVTPYYLPALRCTPDHRLYATTDPTIPPTLTFAKNLTKEHYLVVPRYHTFSTQQEIDAAQILGSHQITFKTPWKLSADDLQKIMDLTADGKSSQEIGALFGKSGSYIRHLRVKMRNGRVQLTKTAHPYVENGTLRFPNERRPGIPLKTELNEDIAELLGYYCAEGSIVTDKNRPNSFDINFSFSKDEGEYAERVITLLKSCFGVSGRLVHRPTTLSVSVTKASLALLLKALAGERSTKKRVPEMLFNAPHKVVRAFLDAYINGDGHRFPNGKLSSTTVSRELAHGIALLALKCGYFPSIYDAERPETSMIEGRTVRIAPHQYTVVWYENSQVERKIIETEQAYLIPLRGLECEPFDGNVFNMEVEEEHNYLAGFFLVSNCQNWFTSQVARDPASDAALSQVRQTSPKEMVALARRARAEVIVSSYNEPLITSEWAVAIFKEAKAAGLMCAYVSNGNSTPEVLAYIKPYISAYKVDLKSMQDKNYRQLGGVLKNTLTTIERAHAMGLWVEVVTLVIPGFNDSNEELWEAARFLRGVSADIPWHVTAFHKDYRMTDPENTPATTLLRAAEIGREAGLNFVYAGNLPGRVEEYETTFCPGCRTPLVRRNGYVVSEYKITGEGNCPSCGAKVPGLWPKDPGAVKLYGIGIPLPVR